MQETCQTRIVTTKAYFCHILHDTTTPLHSLKFDENDTPKRTVYNT